MASYITFDGASGVGKTSLIEYIRSNLVSREMETGVFVEKNEDPFREIGREMTHWCDRHGVDKNMFLGPVIFLGQVIAERHHGNILVENGKNLEYLLDFNHVVLRDRSFISSLIYRTVSSTLTQAQIWDLYINIFEFRKPDCAVIVCADPRVVAQRKMRQKKQERGLGGRMRDDSSMMVSQRKIPEAFNRLLRFLEDRGVPVCLVEDNEAYTDDKDVIASRIGKAGDQVLEFLAKKELI